MAIDGYGYDGYGYDGYGYDGWMQCSETNVLLLGNNTLKMPHAPPSPPATGVAALRNLIHVCALRLYDWRYWIEGGAQ